MLQFYVFITLSYDVMGKEGIVAVLIIKLWQTLGQTFHTKSGQR